MIKKFPLKKIREGSADIFAPQGDKISRELPVFYNPVMKLNRDISILLLQQFPAMNICDLLAGTGIRAIRIAKELSYKSITANDHNKNSFSLIKKNMRYNKVKFSVFNDDANRFLLDSKGFDYIDVDPFGSSNPFLDAAVKRISRDGILAVTNTDTAAMTGTYPKSCIRKYWAKPKLDYMMHETGLRILIRKIQLIGMQYEKALIPLFSYYKDHYMRVFFRCIKGKKECDNIAKQHGMLNDAGPLWLGSLWDKKLAYKMHSQLSKTTKEKKALSKNPVGNKKIIIDNNQNYNELLKFLKIIKDESKINAVGFFDTHRMGKIGRKEELIGKIRKKGHKAASTHFLGTGIRTDIDYSLIEKI
ncbi:methyltransferase [Candidatus Woesearchaeota archaeon]|nr:methyltransferase [Candidatus Woesearchaeota archaeon]